MNDDYEVDLYATCPASVGVSEKEYLSTLVDVVRWSDRSGCAGFLVYSDNSNVDPWLIAQLAMQNTVNAAPLAVHARTAEPEIVVGIRIGILARDDREQAWQVARRRFPSSETGVLMHELAVEMSDATWHGELAEREGRHLAEGAAFWLHPFRNYKTFCPYLVGSHDEVGAYLARYLRLGVRSIILDVPVDEDDLHNAQRALAVARSIAGAVRQ